MQTEKFIVTKIFHHNLIEGKDDLEEKFERGISALNRLGAGGNASEKEIHDSLHTAACRDKLVHDEICLGLLGTILLERDSASKCYRDLTLLTRDNLGIVVETLSLIILEKYHKLTDVSRSQLVWIVREMVKGGANGADVLCWNLMRQVAGGDTSGRNLWLIDYILDVFIEFRFTWLNKFPVLIAAVIYTFLRLLEDHMGPSLASLRQKEATFVSSLIREHFTEVCLNQQIGLGRDFVRQLQAVSRISEIQQIWQDLFYNPKALSPHLTGILQLLNIRTSRKYIQARVTPDMERKIVFLTSQVKFGNQKRYQDWFQKQYFSTVESQTLRADIIRYIVCVIHPPNEILSSDILPRWALIGWLLTTCTNPVAAATAKLALFFDWLVFDPFKDNIMNIEPAILVMYHSLKTYLAITATLLDFLIRLIYEYHPPNVERFKVGVGSALKSILEKRVLQNLDVVLDNPKLEPELRKSIRENLSILLDTNSVSSSIVTVSPQQQINENNLHVDRENHITLDNQINHNNGLTIIKSDNHSNLNPIQISSNSISNNHIISNSSDGSGGGGGQISVSSKQSNNSSLTSLVPNLIQSAGTTSSDPQFSDDEEEEEDIKPELTSNKKIKKDIVDETEKERIFEKIQGLPTNIRLPFDKIMNQYESKVSNGLFKRRSDLLDEVLSALIDEQLDQSKREDLSEALIFVYKSELEKSIVNESTNSVQENIRIPPLNELVSLVIDLKPTDKSLRMKNVMRVLADMITFLPKVAYKLLIILYQLMEKDPDDWESRFDVNNYETLYKNLAQLRGMKLDAQLLQDLTVCWEEEPSAVSYVCSIVYIWYVEDSDLAYSGEILHLLVSTLDASQLQDLSWKVMQEDIKLFDSDTIVPTLLKTLEWESWEQHCVWRLLEAHLRPLRASDFTIRGEEIYPIIPQLDAKKNSEALTALLFYLRAESPTSSGLLSTLLSRRITPRDKFVVNVLHYWDASAPDKLAEAFAAVFVQSCGGSPVKRKRGGGSRGTASPALVPTPNIDTILSYLDELRIRDEKCQVFKEDAMVAALLQVQSWVTDVQKSKYKDLLSLVASAEESDKKSKRPKNLSTSAANKTVGSTGRNTATSAAAAASLSLSASSSISRTRSGKARIPNSDSESSDEEDAVPPPKKPKRTRKVYSSDSD